MKRYQNGVWLLAVVLLPMFVVAGSEIRKAAPETRTTESAASSASAMMIIPQHECQFCHSVHGGTGPTLTRAAQYDLLCMSCHNPTAPVGAAPPADYHTEDPQDSNEGTLYSFQIDCVECHVDPPHSLVTNAWGGTQLKLIRDSVTNPSNGTKYAIRFEALSGDYSFCDLGGPDSQNPDWENICDMCHSNIWAERHHNDPVAGNAWNSSNHHRNGATCTGGNCHNHNRGFQLRAAAAAGG